MHNFSAWRLDRDVIVGLKHGCLIGAAAAVLILPPAGSATSRLAMHRVAAPQATATVVVPHRPRVAEFGDVTPSDDVKYIARWVADSGDNARLAFAILDKRDARVYVFDAGVRLIGASPVLLGVAPGDDSVAGIGQRPISEVRPEERTTPAGRFASTPGRNASGEDVVWVDYADAVSMHRVRPVDPKERRLERLASPDPAQRRISYGCINVPVAFFDAVVHPTLATGPGVVYVLPERKSIRETFASSYAVKEQQVAQAAGGIERQ